MFYCELTGAVLTALPGFSEVCELTGAVLTAHPGFSGVLRLWFNGRMHFLLIWRENFVDQGIRKLTTPRSYSPWSIGYTILVVVVLSI
jgi:Ser/Thr protein kinase RdoA (MazF antagonist)